MFPPNLDKNCKDKDKRAAIISLRIPLILNLCLSSFNANRKNQLILFTNFFPTFGQIIEIPYMSLEKKTTTRYVSEYEYEATNPGGNLVKIDMYPDEEKKAQSPMELLLSAASACAAVDVVGMLKKKRKAIADLTIESVGQRKETHPRYYTHIHLQFKLVSPDTTEEELAKVVHLAVSKYCSVASTLKGVAEITHESIVNSH